MIESFRIGEVTGNETLIEEGQEVYVDGEFGITGIAGDPNQPEYEHVFIVTSGVTNAQLTHVTVATQFLVKTDGLPMPDLQAEGLHNLVEMVQIAIAHARAYLYCICQERKINSILIGSRTYAEIWEWLRNPDVMNRLWESDKEENQ